MKILIFGNGYLGRRCASVWGDEAVVTKAFVNTVDDAVKEIQIHKPNVVLNAAGIVGKPNVDWCDDNQMQTIQGNTVLPIILAEACAKKDVYLLHMGTGCIYYGESEHEDNHWREDDFANPEPAYTRSKYAADLVLSKLPNVGIARLRMPIDWIPSDANLINKLASFDKVIDVENSVTIVEDMIDVFYQLMQKRAQGIFHVTNPGTMKHRDLLALYKALVDPTHSNEWITKEELTAQGLAKKTRSNNFLSSDRLVEHNIHMRPIEEALSDTVRKYAAAKKFV
jgi:3,5-epimerase/4-reductase